MVYLLFVERKISVKFILYYFNFINCVLQGQYKIAIIGGGILGTSIAYFLCSQCNLSVILIEQEYRVAFHASTRNTGKVHAPFLYDPVKKKLFAKAASLGYEMWHTYSNKKQLLFKHDGVLEVATDERGVDRLHKYMKWGEANGLRKEIEIKFLDMKEAKDIEPKVHCRAAIYCSKDASVDYGSLTQSLIEDCESFGCKILLGHKVLRVSPPSKNNGNLTLTTIDNQGQKKDIATEFVVNSAGGNAINIAHSMNVAREFADLHFRGEYWKAPPRYCDLTKLSIYSVPKYPDYPFLDPHWIVRADGSCEVGPNAVPVFGPYAYNWSKNLRYLLPQLLESLRIPEASKILFDKQFLSLAGNELKSSLSKTIMINRAKEFLPQLRASAFTQRGTAGVRSLLIDKHGRFIPDALIVKQDYSMHVLNYNSPGATGALPMAAMIVNQLLEHGILSSSNFYEENKSLWDIKSVAEKMDI